MRPERAGFRASHPGAGGPAARPPSLSRGRRIASRSCYALALCITVLAACERGGGSPEEAGGPDDSKPVTVELVTMRLEPLRDVVKFSGTLVAENEVVLRPEIRGVVEAIEFEEGQQVEKDQVLIRLRDDEQRARVQEARASLRLAQDTFDRTQRLTQRDVSSIARRAEATARLDEAKARVDLARLQLERTRIRAPFDGVVGARLVSPGDRVDDESPLVQVDAVERLQLLFTIAEVGVPLARKGAIVEAQVLAFPRERFTGEVFFVSPTINPGTRMLLLKAWIPNEEGRLKPGMFANVFVEARRKAKALLVPESALVYDRNGTYLWRVGEGERAEKVPVEIGLRQDGRVEIVRGVSAGDVVVSAGTNKVMAGTRVRAAEPASTAQRDDRAGAGEAAAHSGDSS